MALESNIIEEQQDLDMEYDSLYGWIPMKSKCKANQAFKSNNGATWLLPATLPVSLTPSLLQQDVSTISESVLLSQDYPNHDSPFASLLSTEDKSPGSDCQLYEYFDCTEQVKLIQITIDKPGPTVIDGH